MSIQEKINTHVFLDLSLGTYLAETIIVGTNYNNIISYDNNDQGISFFIGNNNINNNKHLNFPASKFPFLKKIYLRSNTPIILNQSCFLNNNNISILDLTGIESDISFNNNSLLIWEL